MDKFFGERQINQLVNNHLVKRNFQFLSVQDLAYFKENKSGFLQCDYVIRLIPVFAISPRKKALLKLFLSINYKKKP